MANYRLVRRYVERHPAAPPLTLRQIDPTDQPAPIDSLSALVGDELLRRQDRLLERLIKHAGFRGVGKALDSFDFDFNKKLNRELVS